MKSFFFLRVLPVLFCFNLHASSPDAWALFQKSVEEKCKAVYKTENPKEESYSLYVDPYGPISYGYAIFKEKEAGKTIGICIYNKKSKEAEYAPTLRPI